MISRLLAKLGQKESQGGWGERGGLLLHILDRKNTNLISPATTDFQACCASHVKELIWTMPVRQDTRSI
jgi:hypothetical protein